VRLPRLHLRRISVDALVNVVIVITCTAVLATIVQQRYRAPSASRPAQPFKIGTKADALAGVRYDSTSATLVLYLNSGCHFCAESLPFYRTLVDWAKTDGVGGHLSLVAVSAEPEPQFVKYLDQNQLRIARVLSRPSATVPTPTLVLVDKRGLIAGVWVGRQTAEGERSVRDATDALVRRSI
jgi:hypothetical protein